MPHPFRLLLFVTFLITMQPLAAQKPLLDSLVTPSSLQQIVEILAHDSMQGRFTGSQQAVSAAHIIAEEFRKAGASSIAGNEGYYMPFYNTNGVAINVIAVLPGKTKANELVLFGAHYDHIGNLSSNFPQRSLIPERGRPEKGDAIYNGANDNASGISGLIHLARYYGKLNSNERTLVFMAFSGEELGLLGSQKVAQSFDPKVVQAMINMDMIGRPVSKDYQYPIITGYDRSNLRGILNDRLEELAPEFGKFFFKPDRYTNQHFFERSDNYSFAVKGIPAHSIMTTGPNDVYYHSLNDEPATLDYEFMAKVVKAIALGSSGIIAGTDTPGRINTAGMRGR